MQPLLPLVLLILDGWGYREATEHNAIAAAHTPQWDAWWATHPHLLLEASGCCVGLPDEQMGNSEVGHMHMGAGRLIRQDYTRINEAIRTGSYNQNPVFLAAIDDMKKTGRSIHVAGLFSPGGVHSHEDHLFAFLDLCERHQFYSVYLHLFLDGRDTPPQSVKPSLNRLTTYLREHPVAQLASISGRYYAMDRDKRWERVEGVYHLLTQPQQHTLSFATAHEAIDAFYQQGIYDEFIPPTRIGTGHAIQDGDTVFFFNFRADRARQLTQALLTEQFDGFVRTKRPNLAHFISMTAYANTLPTQPVFPPETFPNTLGEILAKHHLRQLRIAETEKYAHVTFFFNGGTEQIYPLEDRILIPSPGVATYDLQPEMSAPQLTQTLVEAIEQHRYDVIICNFANADMVGHTGNFEATVQAIESLDRAMKAIGHAVKNAGGQLLITADHGNAEAMFDSQTQQPHTAHTTQPVPLLYVGEGWKFHASHGSLADLAPTLLTLLHITPPADMSGRPLLVKTHDSSSS